MKIRPKQNQSGSAVILFMGLLAIMVICVTVNSISIRGLERELKRVEKKQVERLQLHPGEKPHA
jgi:hypothetical protein